MDGTEREQPVRARLTMTVGPLDAAEFEVAWRTVASLAGRQPGCLRQSLSRSDTKEVTFVIDSDWADIDTFRRFERSPEQDAATEPMRALRRSTEMQILTLIAHLD
jgi:quinol monooxygenase YgiN